MVAITYPTKPKIIKKEGALAVFEIEDLYPGYGITLGNALRRVLLSSIEGAAATSVKIQGVPHEFSTIEGVVEDVVELILNLKQVRFKLHGDEPQVVTLDVSGEREVRAKDLTVPSQVEVVNGAVRIATLTDKKAKLSMEIRIEKGLGYVPVEQRQKEKLAIGEIAVDAIFSPIRKVHYEVENMRVGDRTDFNRIKVLVETDGSLTAEDAFQQAVGILVKQFQQLESFAAAGEKRAVSERARLPGKIQEAQAQVSQDAGEVSLEQLSLSPRTAHALSNAGFVTARDLSEKSEEELSSFKGVGEKAIKEVRKELGKLGLTLRAQSDAETAAVKESEAQV